MTEADKAFVCGGARDLPLADDESWNGPDAEASIFQLAGFDGDDPKPSIAARGFLAHDTDEPELRASYKLPFARSVDGKLVASRSGLQAAASRLPQTDGLSAEARTACRAVIDHYLNRGNGNGKPKAMDMIKLFDSEITAPPEIPPALQQEINRHAGEEVPPDEIIFRYAHLANDRYDRSYERFPREYLERFAETIGGKSMLPGHDRTEIPIGIWLKGEVTRDEGGVQHLRVPFYMDRRSPEGRKVRLGIAKQVSISFKAGGRTCDLCGADYDGANGCENGHRKGTEYDGRVCTVTYSGDLSKVEALEGSLVWLGCQHGAEITPAKAADPYGGHEFSAPLAKPSYDLAGIVHLLQPYTSSGTSSATSGGVIHGGELLVNDLPGSQTLTIASGTGTTNGTVTKAAAAEEKVMPEELDELRAKVAEQEGEIQAKSLEITKLSELAKDGEAYREHLKNEIARKMSAATCETTETAEAEAQGILASLSTANLETLKSWDARAQRLFDAKFPPGVQTRVLGEGAVQAPPRQAEGTPANQNRVFDPRGSMRRAR